MTIEGIPEGWELVRVGCPTNGEFYLGMNGQPIICNLVFHGCAYIVVRKIELPKRYRAFANAAEFEPHRDRWIRRKSNGHKMRTTSYCDNLHFTGNDPDDWVAMLSDYVFDDDGTPFGVEVT